MSDYRAKVGHARARRRDDAITRLSTWQAADRVAQVSRPRNVIPPPDVDAYRRALVPLARRIIADHPDEHVIGVRSRFTLAAAAMAPTGWVRPEALSDARVAAWNEATA